MPEESQNQIPQANNANPVEQQAPREDNDVQQPIQQDLATMQQQPQQPMQQMPMMPPYGYYPQQMPMTPPYGYYPQQMPMTPPMQQAQMATPQTAGPQGIPSSGNPEDELLPFETNNKSTFKKLLVPLIIITMLSTGAYYFLQDRIGNNKASVIDGNTTTENSPTETLTAPSSENTTTENNPTETLTAAPSENTTTENNQEEANKVLR